MKNLFSAKKVKYGLILVCGVLTVLVATFIWSFFDDFIAPLFLNSRIERVHETGLPKALVEDGGIIYCRMKADDFRFPLPPESQLKPPIIISGGFDTVDGSLEVRFGGSNEVTPSDYESWVAKRLQVGGQVTAESVPGGLAIKFHYFGDR
jgi:hypothetical protein